MYKHLWIVVFLALSGCWAYVEPRSTPDSSDPSSVYLEELWIWDAWVSCEYDWWDASVWWLEVDIEASYDYYADEINAGVYVGGWDYYTLHSTDGTRWEMVLESYYYDCNDANVFDFVVSDEYGNFDEATIWW